MNDPVYDVWNSQDMYGYPQIHLIILSVRKDASWNHKHILIEIILLHISCYIWGWADVIKSMLFGWEMGKGTCRRSVAMAVGSVGSWHNTCISQRCKQQMGSTTSALQMLFTEMMHSEDDSLCGNLEWHEERYHNNAIIALMVTSPNIGINISAINCCGGGKRQKRVQKQSCGT